VGLQEGSPASRAGLKSGDVITAYNGREVGRAEELPRAVAETAVGREVPVSVVRDGKTLTLTATVSRLAESEEAAATQTDGKEALGLVVQPLTPAVGKELGLHDRQGVLVRDVEEGSRAANAGLRPGDVVVEIDHQPIRSVDVLRRAVANRKKDTPALFLVHRNDANVFLAVES
jgi:serine protease Do